MQCNYPDCRSRASKTWALAPVCAAHHEAIRAEVVAHYRSRVQIARPHYDAILPYTCWGRHIPKPKQYKDHVDLLGWVFAKRRG